MSDEPMRPETDEEARAEHELGLLEDRREQWRDAQQRTGRGGGL